MATSNNFSGADVVEIVRACLGTPFVHQGRVPGVGIDCAGLALEPAKKLGLEHIDVKGYPRLPHKGMLKDLLDSQPCLTEIKKSDMQEGDLVLIRFTKAPQHLAIYAGENRIIHTYDAVGKVVEHGMDKLWISRIIAVYRFG